MPVNFNYSSPSWAHFTYNPKVYEDMERTYLHNRGVSLGVMKHFSQDDLDKITIELLSNEAIKTSEIEGEYLDRESVQSSIRKHFGYHSQNAHLSQREAGIADMMMDLYDNYDRPLSHTSLWKWHKMLMRGNNHIHAKGGYRTHTEPMQVVSGHVHKPIVHFEAPPSETLIEEMKKYIEWFNQSAPGQPKELSVLTRASIAHLYFVSIHPFEDGNGRIGRALVEKVLAQDAQRPTLISLSECIYEGRRQYYDMLELQNKHNVIDRWLQYFFQVILQAQQRTQEHLDFIIKKTKFFDRYSKGLNARQLKVINRIFKEGIKGFEGGLSAHNYITISQTSASTATRDLADLVHKTILIKKR